MNQSQVSEYFIGPSRPEYKSWITLPNQEEDIDNPEVSCPAIESKQPVLMSRMAWSISNFSQFSTSPSERYGPFTLSQGFTC